MKDLIVALGLIFFLEGLIVAIFPSRIKNIFKKIENISINKLRFTGFIFLFLGFIIVWFAKKI